MVHKKKATQKRADRPGKSRLKGGEISSKLKNVFLLHTIRSIYKVTTNTAPRQVELNNEIRQSVYQQHNC